MTMLKKNFFSAAEAYAAPVCETLDFAVNEGIMLLSNVGGGGQYGNDDTNDNGDF